MVGYKVLFCFDANTLKKFKVLENLDCNNICLSGGMIYSYDLWHPKDFFSRVAIINYQIWREAKIISPVVEAAKIPDISHTRGSSDLITHNDWLKMICLVAEICKVTKKDS